MSTRDFGAGVGRPRPGLWLGPWLLVARLGAGASGSVWRARDAEGRDAAVKVLDPDLLRDEDVVRLAREHDALGRVDHRGIVRPLGADLRASPPWLALELVEGTTLETRLGGLGEGPARYAEAERVFRALAEALDHLHERGLVHRDVKPSNVLIALDGTVKLGDLGAVVLPDMSRITRRGSLVGTIAWMAPEVIAEDAIDGRADLYALGAVLYAMLTGRRPVEADTVPGFLARHLTSPPVAPSEIDPEVPARLERVALRLLEKDPARRFASARAAVAALDAAAGPVAPVGREALVERWVQVLERRRIEGASGIVSVVGPPGSGRSTLVAYLAELARGAGWVVAPLGVPNPSLRADVVVVDDAGALDVAAASRVDAALDAGAIVLAATSPGEAVHGPRLDALSLEPLPRRAVVRLLRELGLPTSVAAALGYRLAGPTGLFPGEAVEQVAALVEAGWLEGVGDAVVATCPVEAFRTRDLPVPPRLRSALRSTLDGLDDDARALLEVLAVLDRPVSAGFLARTLERPARVPAALDALLASPWVRAETSEDDVVLRLAHPGAASAVRAAMVPDRLRGLHGAVAEALLGRRRRKTAEAGRHLVAAGRLDEGVALLAEVAEHELLGGRLGEALTAADDALATSPSAVGAARIGALRGEVLLRLGRWPEAVRALDEAVTAARGVGGAVLARSLGAWGRAMHRLGRYDEAVVPLEDACAALPSGTAEGDAVRRVLADVRLQQGRPAEAEGLLREALAGAVARNAAGDEARAHRGLAHVLGLGGRWPEAAAALDLADETLADLGDAPARAGVLLRRIELEVAAGRYGLALHRTTALLDLLDSRKLPQRLAEALGWSAELRWRLGQVESAVGAAERAVVLAPANAAASWTSSLHAVRVLDAAGRAGERADNVLDAFVRLDDPVHRPDAQAAALRARRLAKLDPLAARDALAHEASLPAARWPLSELARATDAALAWARLGERERAEARFRSALRALERDAAAGARAGLVASARSVGIDLGPDPGPPPPAARSADA